MSRFMTSRYASLVPYVPGEQPKLLPETIKLNTNENPFPPSPKAVEYAAKAAAGLERYCDTECTALRAAIAKTYGAEPDEVICSNGSDEVLDLCFLAFCDEKRPAVFPDITYGFYSIFADVNRIPWETIPLREDFTVAAEDYLGIGKTIFLANPNAPTGIALPRAEIEKILRSNPDSIVVVDEAYIDFGGESCAPLIHKYPNLVVTMTFSKSRSLAGGRLGFGLADKALIRDLNTLRNSRNPYNINAMTQAAGLGAMEDAEYTRRNCAEIVRCRGVLEKGLKELGFEVLPSSTNFVFAKHPRISGEEVLRRLRAENIFVRHFTGERIKDYNRISVGTREQTERLLAVIADFPEVKA